MSKNKKLWWFEFLIIWYLFFITLIFMVFSDIPDGYWIVLMFSLYIGFKIWLIKKFEK